MLLSDEHGASCRECASVVAFAGVTAAGVCGFAALVVLDMLVPWVRVPAALVCVAVITWASLECRLAFDRCLALVRRSGKSRGVAPRH